MAAWALGLFSVQLLVVVTRAVVLRRRTGTLGLRSIGSTPFEFVVGRVFALSLLTCGIVAPALQLLHVVRPVTVLDVAPVHAAGFGLFLLGISSGTYAQFALGDSWRIGVDKSERTELVTVGPFAVVRNPIFSAIMVTMLGIALLAPNLVAIVAWLGLVTAIDLQVRWVEEPYLSRAHGAAYEAYSARVGRFVPWLGRLEPFHR